MSEDQLLYEKLGERPTCVESRTAELDYGPSEARQHEMARQDWEPSSQRILDNLLDLVCTVDTSSVHLYINPSYKRVLGYEPQDLLGESLFDRIHPDDRKRVTDEYEQATRICSNRASEFRYQHGKGHYVWLRSTWNLMFDAAGEFAGATILSHEITEHKQAQAALAESEERFRTLSEATFEGIAFIHDGVFIDVNQQFADLIGYERDELIGMNAVDPALPAHRDQVEEAITTDRTEPYEVVATSKSGKEVALEIRGRFRVIGEKKVRVTAVRDVTERKAAEEALRTSEERLRLALEGTSDGIWDWDLHTNQVSVSPRWYTMLGYEPDELPGCYDSWVQLLHPDDRESADNSVKQAIQQQTPFAIESRLKAKNGEYTWILSRGKVVQFDSQGKPTRVAGSHTDITDRKRKEEEIRQLTESLERRVRERTAEIEATNKELEAFSYSVSHDLQAPLRAINGYARILAEEGLSRLNEEGRRALNVVRGEAQRMGSLIEDLLRFSRLNKQPLQKAETDMTALVQEVFGRIREDASDRHLEFHIDRLPEAKADPPLMRQLWVNLLDNALKYTSGRERAEIAVSGSRQGEELVYSVKDNGAGFDMKYADRLFGVFQRLHRAEEFEGTGVGLALVQRIVHRHGGRIWAEAKVDQGATFHFTLPAT